MTSYRSHLYTVLS